MAAALLDTIQSKQVSSLLFRALEAGLSIREKFENELFSEWIPNAVSKCAKGEYPKQIFIVSGELNCTHWGLLFTKPMSIEKASESEQAYLSDILFDKEFSVLGACCHYIDMPVDGDAKKINEAFKFFLNAREYGKDKIRLYCSNGRFEKHWICVGNEMRVSDWHTPGQGHADGYKTIVIESNDASSSNRDVLNFATEEMNLVIGEMRRHWLYKENYRPRYSNWFMRNLKANATNNIIEALERAEGDAGVPYLCGKNDYQIKGVGDDESLFYLVGKTDLESSFGKDPLLPTLS